MTAPLKPRVRADVVFRQLDDEWVAFDPVAQRLHAMNLTAALVWEHCTGDLTVQEITRAVHDAFGDGGDLAAVARDVEEMIARFGSEGLLE